jgi:hypothetical protein
LHGAPKPPARSSPSLAAAGARCPSISPRGINAINFYAIEASRRMGLDDKAAVRAVFAPYTNADDVDRLVAGVAEMTR